MLRGTLPAYLTALVLNFKRLVRLWTGMSLRRRGGCLTKGGFCLEMEKEDGKDTRRSEDGPMTPDGADHPG
jgi:hypothetical protein